MGGPPRQAGQTHLGEKRTNDVITFRPGGNLLSLLKKEKKKKKMKGVAAAVGPTARTRAAPWGPYRLPEAPNFNST